MDNYRIKIDKEALKQLFLVDKPTPYMLKELRKVINAVLIKHYPNHQNNKDLIQSAYLAVFSRKSNFDSKMSAYNFIYTICRNEIGNAIRKIARITCYDDLSNLNSIISDADIQLPSELEKFKGKLFGTEDYDFVRISKSNLIDLIVFIKLNSTKSYKIPEYIPITKRSIEVLYQLLKESYGKSNPPCEFNQ